MVSLWEAVTKLMISAFLSGLVGIERESANRPAGFRTHVLVGVGSTLVMLVSIGMAEISGRVPADPARIAAQVVSGIGFIGAGTILREGASVRGLTTAASLWVVSAIGLGVGAGMYAPSAMTTLIVILALVILGRLEKAILSRRLSMITVIIDDKPGQIGRIATTLGNRHINIKGIEMSDVENDRLAVTFFVRVPPGIDMMSVSQELISISGVHSLEQK